MSKTEPKRVRKPRRDYQRELTALTAFLDVAISVTEDMVKIQNIPPDVQCEFRGQLQAFQKVKARMEAVR